MVLAPVYGRANNAHTTPYPLAASCCGERATRVMGGDLGVIGGTQFINQIIYPPRENPRVHIHKKSRGCSSPAALPVKVARRKASSGGFMYAPKKLLPQKTAGSAIRCRGVVTTALALSPLYSPFSAIKIVLSASWRRAPPDRLRVRRVHRREAREGGRAFRGLQAFISYPPCLETFGMLVLIKRSRSV